MKLIAKTLCGPALSALLFLSVPAVADEPSPTFMERLAEASARPDLSAENIMEMGLPASFTNTSQFVELAAAFSNGWSQILAEWTNVTTNETQKRLVFELAGHAHPAAFIGFLDGLLSLSDTNSAAISADDYLLCAIAPNAPRNGFLVLHWSQTDVSNLLDHIFARQAILDPFRDYYEEVRSGRGAALWAEEVEMGLH